MKTHQERIKDALKLYDGLILFGSCICILLIFFIHWLLTPIANTETVSVVSTHWKNLFISLFANAIPIFIILIISYFFARKKDSIIQEIILEEQLYKIENILKGQSNNPKIEQNVQLYKFNNLDWNILLKHASLIDINVHYFDTWVKVNYQLLLDFFNHGGKLRLILPSPDDHELVKRIKSRFPNKDIENIKNKIEETPKKFNQILEESSNKKASIETFYTKELGYWCGIRIDRQYLILSQYEHIKKKINIDSPSFLVKIENTEEKKLLNWFEKEFEGLIEASTKNQNCS